ncbi:hypothetical protein ZIOFF_004490 [Zingiber officinale]|uniref:Uncharacterized protein n=1 Tax=Zingiber officinale TaxID=94328 RepID=A0A8J5HT13_ZINOF|nr:hypothetical protein ZIOFF_004490 [Zingiber officinale]
MARGARICLISAEQQRSGKDSFGGTTAQIQRRDGEGREDLPSFGGITAQRQGQLRRNHSADPASRRRGARTRNTGAAKMGKDSGDDDKIPMRLASRRSYIQLLEAYDNCMDELQKLKIKKVEVDIDNLRLIMRLELLKMMDHKSQSPSSSDLDLDTYASASQQPLNRGEGSRREHGGLVDPGKQGSSEERGGRGESGRMMDHVNDSRHLNRYSLRKVYLIHTFTAGDTAAPVIFQFDANRGALGHLYSYVNHGSGDGGERGGIMAHGNQSQFPSFPHLDAAYTSVFVLCDRDWLGMKGKMSSGEFRKVQNLIEQCLRLNMNQKEVVDTLSLQAKIEPSFTELVWQKLEEENQELFQAYHLRLILKNQIMLFNNLLEKQGKPNFGLIRIARRVRDDLEAVQRPLSYPLWPAPKQQPFGRSSKFETDRLCRRLDYQRQFQSHLARTLDLRPQQQVDLFTAGLVEDLRIDIELQKPENLGIVMNMAMTLERKQCFH